MGYLKPILLAAGTWAIEGVYDWKEIPQKIALPQEIGLLTEEFDRMVDPRKMLGPS